jgi:hypothetical protein
MVKFLTGLNKPIFADSYARDLGRNQFSGVELWHLPDSDPVPIDLTMPDPNPPTPLLTTQPQLINQYFQQVQGIDIVRIWLFEGLEGIRFDAQKKIIGIDNQLLTNLTAILDAANNQGVKVYPCLFDSWVVKSQSPQGLPQNRLGNYQSWNTAVKNLMKDIVDNPHDFVTSVLTPLADAIANHPAIYAIDVMNEPEGMTQDTPVVSNSSMRNYISQCCSVIKPRLKVSIGCMRNSTAKSYSNLPIDFCDYHVYGEIASLEPYRPHQFSNKPCIIGECGYTLFNTSVAARSANEVQVARDFVDMSVNKGYSSSLVWAKDFTSDSNRTLIIGWLKQFASSNNQIRPAPAMSFWERLLSFFGG